MSIVCQMFTMYESAKKLKSYSCYVYRNYTDMYLAKS